MRLTCHGARQSHFSSTMRCAPGYSAYCFHKAPEVAMTHSGITVDVLGAGLDRIPQDKQGAILAEFPRLALKNEFKDCLCNIVRRKPATTFDNIVRDFGVRYVEGYTSPNFADVVANAPFSE